MSEPEVVAHHHNSVRFNCQCGAKHEWNAWRGGSQELLTSDGDHWWSVTCGCGRVHIKPRRSFNGRGYAGEADYKLELERLQAKRAALADGQAPGRSEE